MDAASFGKDRGDMKRQCRHRIDTARELKDQYLVAHVFILAWRPPTWVDTFGLPTFAPVTAHGRPPLRPTLICYLECRHDPSAARCFGTLRRIYCSTSDLIPSLDRETGHRPISTTSPGGGIGSSVLNCRYPISRQCSMRGWRILISTFSALRESSVT